MARAGQFAARPSSAKPCLLAPERTFCKRRDFSSRGRQPEAVCTPDRSLSRIQLHLFPLPFPASTGVFVPVPVESGKSVHPCSWSSSSREASSRLGPKAEGAIPYSSVTGSATIESAGESSSIAIVAGAAVESDSCRPTSIESAGESSSIAIVAGAAVESDSCRAVRLCRPTSIESAEESSSIAIVAGAAVESDSCRPMSAFSIRATTDEPGSGSAIAAGSSEGVSCSGLGPDLLRSARFGTSTAVETAFGLVSSTRSGGEPSASVEASAASNGA